MATYIRNIVFDMGGVLVDYDLQRCLESFRKLGFTQIDRYVDPYTQRGFLPNSNAERSNRNSGMP